MPPPATTINFLDVKKYISLVKRTIYFRQDGSSLGNLEGLLASPDKLEGILTKCSTKRKLKNKQTNLLFSVKGQLGVEEVDERAPFLGQVRKGRHLNNFH